MFYDFFLHVLVLFRARRKVSIMAASTTLSWFHPDPQPPFCEKDACDLDRQFPSYKSSFHFPSYVKLEDENFTLRVQYLYLRSCCRGIPVLVPRTSPAEADASAGEARGTATLDDAIREAVWALLYTPPPAKRLSDPFRPAPVGRDRGRGPDFVCDFFVGAEALVRAMGSTARFEQAFDATSVIGSQMPVFGPMDLTIDRDIVFRTDAYLNDVTEKGFAESLLRGDEKLEQECIVDRKNKDHRLVNRNRDDVEGRDATWGWVRRSNDEGALGWADDRIDDPVRKRQLLAALSVSSNSMHRLTEKTTKLQEVFFRLVREATFNVPVGSGDADQGRR